MRCVTIDGNGIVVDVVPQPVDTSTCLTVIGSPGDLQNPVSQWLSISLDDGASIGMSIFMVWVVAWGFKMLVRALDVDERYD